MPLPLLIHPALALFAQRTRIPTSARSIGFCVIWVCISSSSSSGTEARDVRFKQLVRVSGRVVRLTPGLPSALLPQTPKSEIISLCLRFP